MKHHLCLLLIPLALAACGGSVAPGAELRADDPPAAEPPFEATIDAIQDNVFTPICTECHAGNVPSGGLDLSDVQTSYDNLVEVDSRGQRELKRVATDDADNSYLIHKLEGTQESGAQMPKGKPPLGAEEIAVIRKWIDGGALPPGSEPPPDDPPPSSGG